MSLDPSQALRARIEERQHETYGHDAEAREAEALGLSLVALRAWQLHLRDHPDDVAAWSALGVLHEERGDMARAAACRRRLAELGVTPPEEAAPDPPPAELPIGQPTDADVFRYLDLFAGREDHHARMWYEAEKGVGYSPVRQPLSSALVRAHLEGAVTLGVYTLRLDGCVGWVCIDVDATRKALDGVAGHRDRARDLRERLLGEAMRLRALLVGWGLDPLLEDSGNKGYHLWLFLPHPTPARDVRQALDAMSGHLRSSDPQIGLELFPKQDGLAPGGLGNLVKIPLGIHLRTGRRCALLDDAGRPLADPWSRLRQVARRPLPVLGEAPPRPLPPTAPAPVPAPPVPDPGWTEARFESSPQVTPVLQGCGLLRALVEKVLATRHASRDEMVALQHSLGHLPDGVLAVNWLCDRIPNFPAEMRMGAPHRGSPISCATLKKRLKGLDAVDVCTCIFPEEPGKYPNPLRHLDALPAPPPVPRTLDDLLGDYGRQVLRVEDAKRQLDHLRLEAVASLQRIPGARWRVDGGEWAVELEGGIPVLAWHPDV